MAFPGIANLYLSSIGIFLKKGCGGLCACGARTQTPDFSRIIEMTLQSIKIASAGAVRENPAEAFAKGGNSDEHQESILNPVFLLI